MTVTTPASKALKARAFQLACRRSALLHPPQPITPSSILRTYASTSSSSTNSSSSSPSPSPSPSFLPSNPYRRKITLTSDDGSTPWSSLSPAEKTTRTTQQSFNFLLVSLGALGVCFVSYYLYTDLFAPNSKTVLFNIAVSKLKGDQGVREILGPSRSIKAYGESTPGGSKWARSRPMAYERIEDRKGGGWAVVRMGFNVEGDKGRGRVGLEVVETGQGVGGVEWRSLWVRSEEAGRVVYVEGGAVEKDRAAGKGLFGIKWR